MRIAEKLFCDYISTNFATVDDIRADTEPTSIFSMACLLFRYYKITGNKLVLSKVKFLTELGESTVLARRSQSYDQLLKSLNLIEHLMRRRAILPSEITQAPEFFRLLKNKKNELNHVHQYVEDHSRLFESAYYLSIVDRTAKEDFTHKVATVNLLAGQEWLFFLAEDEGIESLLLRFILVFQMLNAKLITTTREDFSKQFLEQLRQKYAEDQYLGNLDKLSISKVLLLKGYLIRTSFLSEDCLDLLDELLESAFIHQNDASWQPRDLILFSVVLHMNPSIIKDSQPFISHYEEDLSKMLLNTLLHHKSLEPAYFCNIFLPLIFPDNNELHLNDIISIWI